MLLVVDVGNTQTHIGTFDGDELTEHWRFATVRRSTADVTVDSPSTVSVTSTMPVNPSAEMFTYCPRLKGTGNSCMPMPKKSLRCPPPSPTSI